MNEEEIYKHMLIPYQKSPDVVGPEDKPNIYCSVNLPKKYDYSFINNNNLDLMKQLETDKYNVSKTIENLFVQNEYLSKYNWNILPDDPSKTGQIFIKHVLLSFREDEIKLFKKNLDKLNLINTEYDNELLFNTIEQIMEFSDNSEIKSNIYPKVFWKKIKGDGNCFYRAVLFSFLENLIFKSDINFLKNFICDFKFLLKDSHLVSIANENKIDLNITFKCLIMLYFSLTSKSHDPIEKTYTVLIKMLNNYRDFDLGIIAYYRVLLYHFIEKNKTKTLSEDFPILISHLLPPEFQENLDFDSFYEKYLFKFYQEAERIAIYLTPFILGYNIELISIEEITDIFHSYKKIIVKAFGLNDEKNIICLLYKRTHYDLIYHEDYFKTYKKYLTVDYIISKKKAFCFICKEEDKHMMARYKRMGKKEVFICIRCLMKEIKFNLKNLFLYFIQKQKRFSLSRNTEKITDFLDYNITLGNIIDTTIKDGIDESYKLHKEFTFEAIMKNIKCSICIMCDKPINSSNNNYNLSCGCYLCSQKCINDYYNFMISTLLFKDNLICFCGYIYEFKNIYKLIKLFNQWKVDCSKLIEFYLNKNKNQCCICLNVFQYNLHECKMIDLNLLLNKEFNHYFCKECINKIYASNSYNIHCNLCDTSQKIQQIS